MLQNLESMLGSSILATDGEIGKAYNILFDDRSWALRYLVVETGSWFTRRKVLMPPDVFGIPDWDRKTIPVLLTRQQVQESPNVDAEQPVSRQEELALIRHYRWADYLSWEPFPHTVWTDLPLPASTGELEKATREAGDPHLRSAREVAGYKVEARDSRLGSIADFIIDDQRWKLPELVVKVEAPFDGHRVLVPTESVSDISWEDRSVRLTRSREFFASEMLKAS